MRTILEAIKRPDAVGTEVVLPWPSLARLVKLRTKEMLVVGAAPGGGKSMLAVAWAVQNPDYTLYLAQDSPSSILARMLAYHTGIPIREVYSMFGDARGRRKLSLVAREITDRVVIEQGTVTVEGIRQRVNALREWIGRAPNLIVVDNLIDLDGDGATAAELSFYSRNLSDLKQLAIEEDTLVAVLHHVTRSKEDRDDTHSQGRGRITLTNLLFAGEREARHVWGVYNDGDKTVRVSVLKQQDGRADPAGNLEVSLAWKPETGRLESIPIRNYNEGHR
jgi:hypothetical protein